MAPNLGSLNRETRMDMRCGNAVLSRVTDMQTEHKEGKWICSGLCRKPVTEPGSTVTSRSPIPSLQLFRSQICGVPASRPSLFMQQHARLSSAGGWGQEPTARGQSGRDRNSQRIRASAWEGWERGAAAPRRRGAQGFVLGSPWAEGRSSAGLRREPRPILPAGGEILYDARKAKRRINEWEGWG